jgi:hypothetical protein
MKRKLIRHMKAESLRGRLADSDRLDLLKRITMPALATFAALRERMRQRPFICVAGGFGGLLSTVQAEHLVRAMQHMRSGSTKLRKVSRDLCNLHAYAAVHEDILVALRLPPRFLAPDIGAEACDAFARLHACFPGLPIHCGAGDDETLQQPILRAICDSSMRVSLAITGIANFSPLCAFVTVESLTVGKLSVGNRMGAVIGLGPEGAASLAPALEKMTQLTSLDLGGARIRFWARRRGVWGSFSLGAWCWVRAWMRCGVVGVCA